MARKHSSVWKLRVGTTTFGPFWINFYVKSEEDAIDSLGRSCMLYSIDDRDRMEEWYSCACTECYNVSWLLVTIRMCASGH